MSTKPIGIVNHNGYKRGTLPLTIILFHTVSFYWKALRRRIYSICRGSYKQRFLADIFDIQISSIKRQFVGKKKEYNQSDSNSRPLETALTLHPYNIFDFYCQKYMCIKMAKKIQQTSNFEEY